jgi:hypothetical protein
LEQAVVMGMVEMKMGVNHARDRLRRQTAPIEFLQQLRFLALITCVHEDRFPAAAGQRNGGLQGATFHQGLDCPRRIQFRVSLLLRALGLRSCEKIGDSPERHQDKGLIATLKGFSSRAQGAAHIVIHKFEHVSASPFQGFSLIPANTQGCALGSAASPLRGFSRWTNAPVELSFTSTPV